MTIDPEILVKRSREYGLEELEIYTLSSRTLQLEISNNKISEMVTSINKVIAIRGSIGKRVGSIVLNDSALNPETILSKLAKITKANPEDENWPGFPSEKGPVTNTLCYDKEIGDIDESIIPGYLHGFINKAIDVAMKNGAERAKVVEGAWTLGVSELMIINSNGLHRTTKCSSNTFNMTVSVETTSGEADKSMWLANRRLDIDEIEQLIEEETSRATLFIGAKPVESGKYDILFTPETAGMLISTLLIPAISALNILENRSPLKDKINKEVFSTDVNIVDDPSLPFEIGSRGFDDEGIGTRNKTIIDKGVFKQPLHSYYTARKANADPTGNGFRSSPGSQPIPYITNMILRERGGGLDDFARDVKKGIVIYEMIGYWMSNPVNGIVKATVTHGLLIENGEVVRPVKGVVITGNIYDWLTLNLAAIGGDLVIKAGVGSPTLWIRDVDIGGE
ncbi:MAG: TldD/PmbA family protein [Desulfurococcaceae archaeon]